MRKQSLSIISAFMISAVLLTGCGDTAPVSDTATPETTEASETAASETEVSDKIPEETADTATAEVSDDTDDALDTNMETATEEENKETPTESEQSEATEETGYVKTEGIVDGYKNPESVPKPTDYDGKTIKTMADLPHVDPSNWDYDKHPIYYGYTDKGCQCVYDGLTNMCYYANMMAPTGMYFGGDKANSIMYNYIIEKGYESCFQVSYEEAKELFGEPDMSTMSTYDWGAPNNLYQKGLINK